MMALTKKKKMLIECSRPPLRFSFYSFFFYKWEIVFQRTYYCKSMQKHFGNLTKTASSTMTYCQTYNFHNWATLLKFVHERMKHGRHLIALTVERENLVHLVGVDSLSFFPQIPSFCLLNSRLKMGCVYNCKIY